MFGWCPPPPNLRLNCWRDLTALHNAQVSNTHLDHLGRGSVGIDIAVPTGTPVYAAKDGVVREVARGLPERDRTTSRGNYIIVDYDDGSQGRYLHLLSVSVEEGWSVGAGDLVGYSNDTGRSTGPHLHYDHHDDRYRREPMDPMAEHAAC